MWMWSGQRHVLWVWLFILLYRLFLLLVYWIFSGYYTLRILLRVVSSYANVGMLIPCVPLFLRLCFLWAILEFVSPSARVRTSIATRLCSPVVPVVTIAWGYFIYNRCVLSQGSVNSIMDPHFGHATILWLPCLFFCLSRFVRTEGSDLAMRLALICTWWAFSLLTFSCRLVPVFWSLLTGQGFLCSWMTSLQDAIPCNVPCCKEHLVIPPAGSVGASAFPLSSLAGFLPAIAF